MAKDSKIMVSGAQANFLKTMLDSAPKKFGHPVPNTATNQNPLEIEKVTKALQEKWVRGR